MGITITKMIDEPTNGRRLNEITGKWERRVGVRHEERMVKGKVKQVPVTIWEECEPPRTFVYGSEEHEANGFNGGTVYTVVEGCEDIPVSGAGDWAGMMVLYADEVEDLLRKYATQYADAMFVLHGGTFSNARVDPTPMVALEKRDVALARAARFGVDLAQTNVDASLVRHAREQQRVAREAEQKARDGAGASKG